MKKKLIILVLFILGCSTDPEDCAGVFGGTVIKDCNGVCDGEAVYDKCKEAWDLIQENIFPLNV